MIAQLIQQLKEQWVVFIPILGVTITASVAYLVGRPRWYAKLDEQYQKVLAPLYQLLFWPEEGMEKDQEIESIFRKNYCFVPQHLIDLWKKGKDEQLETEVYRSFHWTAKRLGYGKGQYRRRIIRIVWFVYGAATILFAIGEMIGSVVYSEPLASNEWFAIGSWLFVGALAILSGLNA